MFFFIITNKQFAKFLNAGLITENKKNKVFLIELM